MPAQRSEVQHPLSVGGPTSGGVQPCEFVTRRGECVEYDSKDRNSTSTGCSLHNTRGEYVQGADHKEELRHDEKDRDKFLDNVHRSLLSERASLKARALLP